MGPEGASVSMTPFFIWQLPVSNVMVTEGGFIYL